MKKIITIAAAFLFAAAALQAQGLTFRTGVAHPFSEPQTPAGLNVNADYRNGHILFGADAEFPRGDSNHINLSTRTGVSVSGRHAGLSVFGSLRYEYQDHRSFLVGYGVTLDIGIAGPLGLFVEYKAFHPAFSDSDRITIPRHKKQYISYGIILWF